MLETLKATLSASDPNRAVVRRQIIDMITELQAQPSAGFPQINGTITADTTISAGYSAVICEEYVMDATYELIFSDPSEMAVI